jgi:signal peptidase I
VRRCGAPFLLPVSPVVTHVKFGTILRVSSDSSSKPEKIVPPLPKDFVQHTSRYDSLEPSTSQTSGLESAPETLPKRFDYLESTEPGSDSLQHENTAPEPPSNQPQGSSEHSLEPVTTAAQASKPQFKPEKTVNAGSRLSTSQTTPRASSSKLDPKPWYIRAFRELILETLLPAWLIVTFLFIPVGVRGESMSPTLESGDFLLVNKLERWLNAWNIRPNYLHRSDIIVLKPPIESLYSFEPVSRLVESLPLLGNVADQLPEGWKFRPYFVKRIIGMPGDTVELKGGVVYVNDRKTREFYINTPAAIEFSGPTVVRANTVFVMGDNRHRGSSLDSRVFGLVHFSDIAGRAVLRLGHSSQPCDGVLNCAQTWLGAWHFGAP